MPSKNNNNAVISLLDEDDEEEEVQFVSSSFEGNSQRTTATTTTAASSSFKSESMYDDDFQQQSGLRMENDDFQQQQEPWNASRTTTSTTATATTTTAAADSSSPPLNPHQRRVIQDLDNNIFVEASPGTGKTYLLVQKVKQLMQDGVLDRRLPYRMDLKIKTEGNSRYPPLQGVNRIPILILTFSKKARLELQERLDGVHGGLKPFVHTFHSFCLQVLRANGYKINFPIKDDEEDDDSDDEEENNEDSDENDDMPGNNNLADVCISSEQMFQETLAQFMPKNYKMSYQVLTGYRKWQRKQVLRATGYDDLVQDIEKKEQEENHSWLFGDANDTNMESTAGESGEDSDTSLAPFSKHEWNIHLRGLFENRKLHSYQDLQVLALPLLVKMKPKVGIALIDEMQDTSVLQLAIIRSLNVTGRAIAVGDPKQSIYEWREARLQNIEDFKKLFNARTYHLVENYRSNHHIVKTANSFLHSDMTTSIEPHQKKSVIVDEFTSWQHCSEQLFPQIQDLLEQNRTVAVLCRTRKVRKNVNTILKKCKLKKKRSKDIPADLSRCDLKKLSVLTLHQSKGKEFDVVFILGVNEGEFRPSSNGNNEEKRVFYVGMTRARQRLYLYCWRNWSGWNPVRSPSPYLVDIVRKNAKGKNSHVHIDRDLYRRMVHGGGGGNWY